VASSWRAQRWDSLRLLTPNWFSRLPGYEYRGDDPDGYMSAPQVVAFIEGYAKEIAAPVRANTTVTAVRREDGGYVVETDQETWHAGSVVVAAGAATAATMPDVHHAVPAGIEHRVPAGSARDLPGYRNPNDLPHGGVLVVGPSASGIQIAQEVHASGRPVTLAVGEHVRMPRTYRGRDVLWWMDATGLFDDRYDEIPDLPRARVLPSMQLIGSPERATLDLNTLTRTGVQLVGRLAGVRDGVAQLSGSLPNVCTLADLKLNRLLGTIDAWAAAAGLDDAEAAVPPPTQVPDAPRLSIDLVAEGYESVVWATGFRADYSWLELPVLDRKGEIRHDGGVVRDAPGLYRMGLNFLRRRKSSFIHGAGDDATDLVDHLTGHLETTARTRPETARC
jgi:putative flavoprotein involved in K+ transport